jgi:hypothetical protein
VGEITPHDGTVIKWAGATVYSFNLEDQVSNCGVAMGCYHKKAAEADA